MENTRKDFENWYIKSVSSHSQEIYLKWYCDHYVFPTTQIIYEAYLAGVNRALDQPR